MGVRDGGGDHGGGDDGGDPGPEDGGEAGIDGGRLAWKPIVRISSSLSLGEGRGDAGGSVGAGGGVSQQ